MIRLLIKQRYYANTINIDNSSIISTADINKILRTNKSHNNNVKIVNDKIYNVSKVDDKIVYEEKLMYSKIEKILHNKLDKPDNIKEFKYDLPIPNIDPEIISLDEVLELKKSMIVTPLTNLFDTLDNIDKSSSCEDFQLAIKNKYNFNELLYKDINEDTIDINIDVEHKDIKDLIKIKDISLIIDRNDKLDLLYHKENKNKDILITYFKNDIIPVDLLTNDTHMATIKSTFELNLNMPGAIEFEDTNRFIPNLRPVEDFKHTPLVPISDVLKKDFKDSLDRYHRKKYYFEVSRDQVGNFFIAGIAGFIMYILIKAIMDMDEEINIEYERKKLDKLRNN